MKKQEYLVCKYNKDGCNYDNRHYSTYRAARADLHKGDVMYICREGGVYYGDNWRGWTVRAEDVIRTIEL
jgi:hypothetical protein